MHRCQEVLPLYQQVSREGCVLPLSEHHGDATPGGAVRIRVADVVALQAELEAPRAGGRGSAVAMGRLRWSVVAVGGGDERAVGARVGLLAAVGSAPVCRPTGLRVLERGLGTARGWRRRRREQVRRNL